MLLMFVTVPYYVYLPMGSAFESSSLGVTNEGALYEPDRCVPMAPPSPGVPGDQESLCLEPIKRGQEGAAP